MKEREKKMEKTSDVRHRDNIDVHVRVQTRSNAKIYAYNKMVPMDKMEYTVRKKGGVAGRSGELTSLCR